MNVIVQSCQYHFPNSKVHGANMGPIWGRQDPGGPHVDPTSFAFWVDNSSARTLHKKDIIWTYQIEIEKHK